MSRGVGRGKMSRPATLPSISKWRRHWISGVWKIESGWVKGSENDQPLVRSIGGWLGSRLDGRLAYWLTDWLADWLTRWLTRWLFMCWASHGWFSEMHRSISSRESRGKLPRLTFWPVFIGIRFAENSHERQIASSEIIRSCTIIFTQLNPILPLFKQSRY